MNPKWKKIFRTDFSHFYLHEWKPLRSIIRVRRIKQSKSLSPIWPSFVLNPFDRLPNSHQAFSSSAFTVSSKVLLFPLTRLWSLKPCCPMMDFSMLFRCDRNTSLFFAKSRHLIKRGRNSLWSSLLIGVNVDNNQFVNLPVKAPLKLLWAADCFGRFGGLFFLWVIRGTLREAV